MSIATYSIETYKNNKYVNIIHGVRTYRLEGLLECWECSNGDQCDLKESVNVCRGDAAWENLRQSGTHDFKDVLGTLWCVTRENLRNYDQ